MVAGSEEYLEAKYDHMGILHPEAVATTEVGIVWANKSGCYIFTGEGRPQSMTDGRIDKDEWAAFVTNKTILGYDVIQKQLIVISNCTDIDTQDETATHDMYIHNLVTGSWNRAMDKIGDGTNATMSNICNYTDISGNAHTITHFTAGDLVEWMSASQYAAANSSTYAVKPFNLTSKELTGGSPHLRKKFYKVYITYRGNVSTNKPIVKLHIVGPSASSSPITLEAATDFADASSDWKFAEFKPSSSDIAKCKNIYSVQIEISGADVNQDFEINDLSMVFRAKGVK